MNLGQGAFINDSRYVGVGGSQAFILGVCHPSLRLPTSKTRDIFNP